MKKVFAVSLIIMLMVTCATAEKQIDPEELYAGLNTLWGIPFGISESELVAAVKEKTGIQLKEWEGNEYVKSPDPYYIPVDDQVITMLGYPLDSLSFSFSDVISPYGATDENEEYELANAVFTEAGMTFQTFEYDTEESGGWRNATDLCLADGIPQFNAIFESLLEQYGEPSIAFVLYQEGLPLLNRVEYKGYKMDAPSSVLRIEPTTPQIESSMIIDTINWELEAPDNYTRVTVEVQFDNVSLTGYYSGDYLNCTWRNRVTFGTEDNSNDFYLYKEILELYNEATTYDKNINIGF